MPTIDTKTIEETAELVKGALLTYRTELDAAYLKSENALKVNLPVTFKPSQKQNGAWDIEVGINFATSQIKDKFNRTYLPGQEGLFKGKEPDNVHYIKTPVTSPEDWYSALEWLIGWAKDDDKYTEYEICPLDVPAYSKLNDMRDDLEERMDIINGFISLKSEATVYEYRKRMYGIEEDADNHVLQDGIDGAITEMVLHSQKKRAAKKAVGQTWVENA
jgi:hypothetical protein